MSWDKAAELHAKAKAAQTSAPSQRASIAPLIVGAFAVLALVVAVAMFDALRASWRAK